MSKEETGTDIVVAAEENEENGCRTRDDEAALAELEVGVWEE